MIHLRNFIFVWIVNSTTFVSVRMVHISVQPVTVTHSKRFCDYPGVMLLMGEGDIDIIVLLYEKAQTHQSHSFLLGETIHKLSVYNQSWKFYF